MTSLPLAPSWTELLPQLREAADAGRFHHHVSMNAHKMAWVRSSVQGAEIVARAHSWAADGVWAQRGRSVARVPGIELAERLLEEASVRGWRVALVGARAEVVAEVGLPSEASDRQGARFEGRIATNAPIVAAHHAGFEVKFVGHDHAEVAAVSDLPGEVEPAPARVA